MSNWDFEIDRDQTEQLGKVENTLEASIDSPQKFHLSTDPLPSLELKNGGENLIKKRQKQLPNPIDFSRSCDDLTAGYQTQQFKRMSQDSNSMEMFPIRDKSISNEQGVKPLAAEDASYFKQSVNPASILLDVKKSSPDKSTRATPELIEPGDSSTRKTRSRRAFSLQSLLNDAFGEKDGTKAKIVSSKSALNFSSTPDLSVVRPRSHSKNSFLSFTETYVKKQDNSGRLDALGNKTDESARDLSWGPRSRESVTLQPFPRSHSLAISAEGMGRECILEDLQDKLDCLFPVKTNYFYPKVDLPNENCGPLSSDKLLGALKKLNNLKCNYEGAFNLSTDSTIDRVCSLRDEIQRKLALSIEIIDLLIEGL